MHSPSGLPSVHSVLPCTCRKEQNAATHLEFYKFAVFTSALSTVEVHSKLSPNLAGVHPARFSVSLNTLCICCTTEAASGYLRVFVMAWHSDFNDASFYVQYFRNPRPGTSGILICSQVHQLFGCFAQHWARRGRPAKFTDNTFAKRPKSVKTTLASTRFAQITKSNWELV
jgi:hypothetical protein